MTSNSFKNKGSKTDNWNKFYCERLPDKCSTICESFNEFLPLLPKLEATGRWSSRDGPKKPVTVTPLQNVLRMCSTSLTCTVETNTRERKGHAMLIDTRSNHSVHSDGDETKAMIFLKSIRETFSQVISSLKSSVDLTHLTKSWSHRRVVCGVVCCNLHHVSQRLTWRVLWQFWGKW